MALNTNQESLCSFCQLLFQEFGQSLSSPEEIISLDLGNSSGCSICKGYSKRYLALISKLRGVVLGSQEPDQSFINPNLLFDSSRIFQISTKVHPSIAIAEDDFLDRKVSYKALINNFIRELLKPKLSMDFNGEIDLSVDFLKDQARAHCSTLFYLAKYTKDSRTICQNKWECSCNKRGCEKCNFTGYRYESVGALVEKGIKSILPCTATIIHCNGREDVNVRMLGTGRYCVIEVTDPESIVDDLNELENSINSTSSAHGVLLRVLARVPRNFVNLISQSNFDKEYEAIVSCEGEISSDSLSQLAAELHNRTLAQRTPTRVVHRRADLVRRRTVRTARVEQLSPCSFKLTVVCQAGTYIKELVSGDSGRTIPSVSSLLGKQCLCSQLDVIGIRDSFVEPHIPKGVAVPQRGASNEA